MLVAFFEYRYHGCAVSFGGALGDAFAESVRRVSLSPRFRGWCVRNVAVSVEPVDGSDLVDVYVSAEVGGDSAVVGERAFEALVRESAWAVGVRVYGFDAPEDCPLGVHDLAVASSACYG